MTTPDIVEHDKKKMTKPVYDFILGWKAKKELGIVQDFQTKETIVNEIMLPMRDINSLTMPNMEKAWAVSNSMACHPSSTQEVT